MKLKATYETEVYISNGGYLAIKQKDHLGNEDPVVILSPDQARAVMNEFQRLLDDPSWWNEIENEDEE
ncbi:hypothetical protein NX872_21150 [Burkholderia thailandensis]|uniref:hypothetical protein n=1 Tax=Burkholderia thailandensis TaxID=57975 RepID=UPI000CB0EC26|nr:hypothetical protein [Burkholderia thailandensis]MCS6490766.1 hypothetical protein [Burkholderia thailandensis]MCS6518142.1 hypothetical protein [Burkholderia thailandensis]PJO72571.1 hypothetical protein CWD92_09010 [Burkholderia thailandensis]